MNFVGALSEEETGRLQVLRLRGKQRAVMNLILISAASGHDPSAAAIKKTGASGTHFYEITAVLLKKCFKLLVPQSGIALLEFLAYKNLPFIFRQEVLRQEKKFAGIQSKESEDFYLSVFELSMRFSYPMLDKDMIAVYSKKYLASQRKALQEDALAIRARMLHITMTGLLADGKHSAPDREKILAELKELEKAALNSSHPYLTYAVYLALGWYWQNLGMMPDQSLRAIQRAIPGAEQLEGFIFREIRKEMQLRIADANFMLGKTVDALTIFEETYKSAGRKDVILSKKYYLFRYIEILIYNEDYSRAEYLLNEHFEPSLSLRPASASAGAAMLFTMLYLFTGDMAKARHYIDIGFQVNSGKKFALYHDIRNRYLEAVAAYLAGDWALAQVLTHRAQQFLYSNNIGTSHHIFGYFFKIVDASIDYHSSGKKFTKRYEEKFKLLTLPKEGLLGLLLKKVRFFDVKEAKNKKM